MSKKVMLHALWRMKKINENDSSWVLVLRITAFLRNFHHVFKWRQESILCENKKNLVMRRGTYRRKRLFFCSFNDFLLFSMDKRRIFMNTKIDLSLRTERYIDLCIHKNHNKCLTIYRSNQALEIQVNKKNCALRCYDVKVPCNLKVIHVNLFPKRNLKPTLQCAAKKYK